MGRWTLHLSVGIALVAVLLTCSYAEGEKDQIHVTSTHLFIENIYCEIFLSAVCLKLLRCRLTEPVLSANCLVLICRFFTRFVLISLCRLNYKLITESYNWRIIIIFLRMKKLDLTLIL